MKNDSPEKSGSLRGKIKGAVTLGLIGVAGFFALSPKELNLLHYYPGGEGKSIGKRALKHEALREYEADYHRASPAKKFRLQYLTKNEYSISKHEGSAGFIGFLQGLSNDSKRTVEINNGCLADTAYDPNGPVESHFSEAHPHQLVIETGHDLPNLRFDTATNGNRLLAIGHQTRTVLHNHDCQLGVISHDLAN